MRVIKKFLSVIFLSALFVSCKKDSSKTADVVIDQNSKPNALMARQSANTHFSTTQSNVGNDLYQGTFTATGFVSGNGTTNEVVYVTYPSSGNPIALNNATYTFHSTQTFDFGNGNTITIKPQGQWFFTSPGIATGSGTWAVIAGTGTYLKIKGTGTVNITSINLIAGTTADEYDGNLFYAN